jgi:nucleoside phosphorylase
MKVLVTFAVDAEFSPWRAIRPFQRAENGDLQIWTAKIEGCEVTVVLTGMGERSSAQVMGAMIDRCASNPFFDVCVSSGLAGSLNASHGPGEILVAEQLKSAAVQVDRGKDSLAVDAELLALAVSCGAKRVNALFTADHVLTTAREKALLSTVADIVDMESFGIIQAGHARGARGVAVRAVSDAANEDMPIDFNKTISSDYGVSIPHVLAELAKHPLSLPALIQFGKQSRRAAVSLGHFLDSFIVQLDKQLARRVGEAVTEK